MAWAWGVSCGWGARSGTTSGDGHSGEGIWPAAGRPLEAVHTRY